MTPEEIADEVDRAAPAALRDESLRQEGRREVWREIAKCRPQAGQSWCWFCHAPALVDYSLNHHRDCLYRRAVEAMSEPEGR